jgi:hypothetical protein
MGAAAVLGAGKQGRVGGHTGARFVALNTKCWRTQRKALLTGENSKVHGADSPSLRRL